ncbi:hypothetical protein TREMEDRAFT_61720 [Tremella mesenterica DSM 1558]|uniref:uncharacterized protein n=1 Tax=Tremella mesenterica (strain ATCC 24925 / CBS 8224 / DSM 1558 / NBRC 9311 / NRRL Y-6157 / RJB 2259-6 / UBC 559-6) TaxID=578456 RepID=UPI0003F49C9F|nr:uncharacterized protein TREMEDRAFT_61720 [Tremella mesenterica DSM 1558]EIW69952.1 hypothetical protein TREMEDRAFT_61720 [Tremella mesenterica DSM 1558]
MHSRVTRATAAAKAKNDSPSITKAKVTASKPSLPSTSMIQIRSESKKRSRASLSSTPQPQLDPFDSHPSKSSSRQQPRTKPRLSNHNPVSTPPTRATVGHREVTSTSVSNHLVPAQSTSARSATFGLTVDENPLPTAPRAGMGDVYPSPPESDIRSEAFYIIRSAQRHQEELRKSRMTSETPPLNDAVTPPTPPQLPRPRLQLSSSARGGAKRQAALNAQNAIANGMHDDTDEDRLFSRSLSPPNKIRLPPIKTNDPFESSRQSVSSAGSSLPLVYQADVEVYRPAVSVSQVTMDDFDEQFAKTVSAYRNGQYSKPREDYVIPKSLANGRPAVVLATKTRPKDRFDRAHQEGYEALLPELEEDIRGFLESVKANAKAVVDFRFKHASQRREAFIEAIGRGLTGLGWQLTDNADGAFDNVRPCRLP